MDPDYLGKQHCVELLGRHQIGRWVQDSTAGGISLVEVMKTNEDLKEEDEFW